MQRGRRRGLASALRLRFSCVSCQREPSGQLQVCECSEGLASHHARMGENLLERTCFGALLAVRYAPPLRYVGQCSISLGRSPRNKSSDDMALPHPQPRKGHYRKKDKPSCRGIAWEFFKRAINIAEYRNGKDEVNPANNRTHGGISHEELALSLSTIPRHTLVDGLSSRLYRSLSRWRAAAHLFYRHRLCDVPACRI